MDDVIWAFEKVYENVTEAVEIYRELAERLPERYRPDLATSLGALGRVHHEEGDEAAAREAFWEGILTLENLFIEHPQSHAGLMARLLGAYNEACQEAGVEPDAARLQAIGETIGRLQAEEQRAEAESEDSQDEVPTEDSSEDE